MKWLNKMLNYFFIFLIFSIDKALYFNFKQLSAI